MKQNIHLCLQALSVLWSLKKDLWTTNRPLTNLFAFAWTIAGFLAYENLDWSLVLLNALTFAGITANIMVFNDIIDRVHDFKKGKWFVYKNLHQVVQYWPILMVITAWGILLIAIQNPVLGLYCLAILVIGILYSYIPHWYVTQNIIVAFCSASPVLCGLICYREVTLIPTMLSITIFGIIFLREIIKDVEDMEIDGGYKATIPVATRLNTPSDENLYLKKGSLSERFYTLVSGSEKWWKSLPRLNVELFVTVKVATTIAAWTALMPFIFLSWFGVLAGTPLALLKPAFFLLLTDKKYIYLPKRLLDTSIVMLFITSVTTMLNSS